MTLLEFFNGLGAIFQWTFQWLQNDFFLTWLMNYGAIVLGFVGFAIWMRLQAKYNAEAESNPDQLK